MTKTSWTALAALAIVIAVSMTPATAETYCDERATYWEDGYDPIHATGDTYRQALNRLKRRVQRLQAEGFVTAGGHTLTKVGPEWLATQSITRRMTTVCYVDGMDGGEQ